MDINNCVYSILKKIQEEGVPYVILRNYIPINNIEKSIDVDVYIPPKYKNKVREVFNENDLV